MAAMRPFSTITSPGKIVPETTSVTCPLILINAEFTSIFTPDNYLSINNKPILSDYTFKNAATDSGKGKGYSASLRLL
jgi:hypothetical protein